MTPIKVIKILSPLPTRPQGHVTLHSRYIFKWFISPRDVKKKGGGTSLRLCKHCYHILSSLPFYEKALCLPTAGEEVDIISDEFSRFCYPKTRSKSVVFFKIVFKRNACSTFRLAVLQPCSQNKTQG